MTLNKFDSKKVLKSSKRSTITLLPDIIMSKEPITDLTNGTVTSLVMSSMENGGNL